eukprot:gene19835-biopygen28682
MASLLQLLEDQDAGHWSLAPTNTVVHNTALAFETLRHGDHVVVIGGWRNGYAHHGIVSRPHTSDTPSIANFSSPTGNSKMRDAKLQFVRYDIFLAGHRTFGCVPYSGEEGDEAMQRDEVIKRVADTETCVSLARSVPDQKMQLLSNAVVAATTRDNYNDCRGQRQSSSIKTVEDNVRALTNAAYVRRDHTPVDDNESKYDHVKVQLASPQSEDH